MKKSRVGRIIIVVILILFLAVILTPLWWSVCLSFDREATTALPAFSWLPHEFTLFNYKAAAKTIDLGRYYINTIFIALVNTFISAPIVISTWTSE